VFAWRWALTGVAAGAAALVLLVLSAGTVFGWTGEAGWALQPSGTPYVLEVTSVRPRSPAATAGVRPRDRIDVRSLSFGDRVYLITQPIVAGRPLHVTVERAGVAIPSTIVPQRGVLRWDGWLGNLILLWMAVFAAVIGWRRPLMAEARLLSLALSCYVAGNALQFLTTPSPVLNAIDAALNTGGILGAACFAALIGFNGLFGRPPSRTRRVVDALAYATTAVLAGYGVLSAVSLAVPAIDPVAVWYGTVALALIVAANLAVVVSGAAAIAASHRAERQRVAWAVVSIAPLLVTAVMQIALSMVSAPLDVQNALQTAVNVLGIVAPVGLTYSVLSRRLLDIGFVLNRAAAFSALSVMLVATFMAIEWALGGWVVKAGNVRSTAVGIAVALGLGFSMRFLHGQVHHVIDRLLFSKRHAGEHALLRFAREVTFITDRDTLVRRTAEEVTEHARASGVAILTRTPHGTFAPAYALGAAPAEVDGSDPAIVALRAWMESVDLHRYESALHGERAFPMASRGELLGVLVCGQKTNGHGYAPDVARAIDEVAHGAGMALDMLTAGGERAELERAVVALRAQIDGLRAELREALDALHARETAPPQ
jgi:type III secretory pathway component EscS